MTNGVKGSITDNRPINLKDVEVDFKKYNFSIFLNGTTIDTSVYSQAKYSDGQIAGAYPSDKKGWLVLTTSNEGNLASGDLLAGEKRILIFEETVQDIKVKSIRNFLENQKTK